MPGLLKWNNVTVIKLRLSTIYVKNAIAIYGTKKRDKILIEYPSVARTLST